MKTPVRLIVLSSVIFLVSVTWLSSGVIPSPGSESVPQLFSVASHVLKGEVVSVAEVGGDSTSLRHFVASVAVDRLYEGALSSRIISIRFERPAGTQCTVSPCISLKAGEYLLFFLTTSNDRYALAHAHFGKFAVSRMNAQSAVSGMPGLELDLIAGLRDADEKRRLINIELLGAMGGTAPVSALKDVISDSSPLVKIAAYTALLRLQEYSILADAAGLAGQFGDDPRILQLQDRMSLYISEIRDPKALPTLRIVARSQSDWVREAAIHALREMAAPESVPVFIAALDDPVKLIRYDAVLGLAAIEQKWELAPSVDVFERAESSYILAWKNWWLEAGALKYGAPRNP